MYQEIDQRIKILVQKALKFLNLPLLLLINLRFHVVQR